MQLETRHYEFWPQLRILNQGFLGRIAKIYVFNEGASLFLLTKDDRFYSLGRNDDGQLGVGDREHVRDEPYEVRALRGKCIVSVTHGECHVMALTHDGQLYGWGDNEFGQVGVGQALDQLEPKLIPLPGPVKKVRCAVRHTVALLQDGTIWTWGFNGYGQIGNGTRINQKEPTMSTIPFPLSAVEVQCNDNNTLAVLSDSTIYLCGQRTINDCYYHFTLFTMYPTPSVHFEVAQLHAFNMDEFLMLTTDGDLYHMRRVLSETVIRRQVQLPEPIETILALNQSAHVVLRAKSRRVYYLQRDIAIHSYLSSPLDAWIFYGITLDTPRLVSLAPLDPENLDLKDFNHPLHHDTVLQFQALNFALPLHLPIHAHRSILAKSAHFREMLGASGNGRRGGDSAAAKLLHMPADHYQMYYMYVIYLYLGNLELDWSLELYSLARHFGYDSIVLPVVDHVTSLLLKTGYTWSPTAATRRTFDPRPVPPMDPYQLKEILVRYIARGIVF